MDFFSMIKQKTLAVSLAGVVFLLSIGILTQLGEPIWNALATILPELGVIILFVISLMLVGSGLSILIDITSRALLVGSIVIGGCYITLLLLSIQLNLTTGYVTTTHLYGLLILSIAYCLGGVFGQAFISITNYNLPKYRVFTNTDSD